MFLSSKVIILAVSGSYLTRVCLGRIKPGVVLGGWEGSSQRLNTRTVMLETEGKFIAEKIPGINCGQYESCCLHFGLERRVLYTTICFFGFFFFNYSVKPNRF